MKCTDAEFLRAFEKCELAGEDFGHREHIRLAWIYLHLYGADAATRMRASIRQFAAHHGKSDKYHETITVAWIRLLEHARDCGAGSFEDLMVQCPQLIEKGYLREFYSEAALASDIARHSFVPPDLRPFPLWHTGITPLPAPSDAGTPAESVARQR